MKRYLPSIKVNKLELVYFSILLILFGFFLILVIFNNQVKKELSLVELNQSPLEFKPGPYPVLSRGLPQDISAQGAIVMDKNTKVVLYEKNSGVPFPPASTTKIMTALTAMDYFHPQDILTVKQTGIEGSVIGFSQGEQLTFEDFLYAMMLPSANDATLAIAQNYPGGEVEFVKKMNEKALGFHLNNTHFEDPVGLRDDLDYSTAYDLARLTSIALEDEYFANIVNTKSKIIENTKGKTYSLKSLNRLLGTMGVNGVKTGYTEAAGEVLVTSQNVENTNQDLIIVVMQSGDRFGDTTRLLQSLQGNINYLSIHP